MNVENRRATPRIRVQFRITFSATPTLEGTGIILDLSAGGCRVESPLLLTSGVTLELRIHVPDLAWPVMVEAATVQWVSDQSFGLAFLRMKDPERQRLDQLISALMSASN